MKNNPTSQKHINIDYYALIKRIADRHNISFEDALLIIIKNGMKIEKIKQENPEWEKWIKKYITYMQIKQKTIALEKELEYFRRVVPKIQKSIERAQDERVIIQQVYSNLKEKLSHERD